MNTAAHRPDWSSGRISQARKNGFFFCTRTKIVPLSISPSGRSVGQSALCLLPSEMRSRKISGLFEFGKYTKRLPDVAPPSSCPASSETLKSLTVTSGSRSQLPVQVVCLSVCLCVCEFDFREQTKSLLTSLVSRNQHIAVS